MRLSFLSFLAIGLLIILYQSLFILDARMTAVIFQFGKAVKTVNEAGIYIKVPFIQTIQYFDNRILQVDIEAKEITVLDGESTEGNKLSKITVDAFCKYKIVDPLTFFKTIQSAANSSSFNLLGTTNYSTINTRLNTIIESAMRDIIGSSNLSDMLSQNRVNIMLQIKELVYKEAKNFGIEIFDVRLLRVDLPKENSNAIYSRMRSEREKDAKQIRAEGMEEAAIIRSNADRESRIIIANAQKESTIIKGTGDAEAAKTYNESYSKDPEFYKFYRTMISYKNTLKSDDTSFILSPDSKFLKLLDLNK
jgi:membrane protease subunit HflC